MSEQKPTFSLLNLTFRLGVIAAVSAVVLTVVNQLTIPARDAAKASVVQDALKTVLPPFKKVGDPIQLQNCTFYPAFGENDQLIAFAAEGKGIGYGGEMTVMFGLSLDGTIGIVDVVSQNETPGLGTIESKRSQEKTVFNFLDSAPAGIPPNKYLDQFDQKKVPPTFVKGKQINLKELGVDFKTGATVTMVGLTEAIYGTADVFMKNKATLEAKANEQKGRNP